jgi:hypothetical protein
MHDVLCPEHGGSMAGEGLVPAVTSIACRAQDLDSCAVMRCGHMSASTGQHFKWHATELLGVSLSVIHSDSCSLPSSLVACHAIGWGFFLLSRVLQTAMSERPSTGAMQAQTAELNTNVGCR